MRDETMIQEAVLDSIDSIDEAYIARTFTNMKPKVDIIFITPKIYFINVLIFSVHRAVKHTYCTCVVPVVRASAHTVHRRCNLAFRKFKRDFNFCNY